MHTRPKRIEIAWTDPFDDRPLCSEEGPYEPRKAAQGYYTQRVQYLTDAYKSLFSDILEGRTPMVSINLIR